jgi:hypothetical protein
MFIINMSADAAVLTMFRNNTNRDTVMDAENIARVSKSVKRKQTFMFKRVL